MQARCHLKPYHLAVLIQQEAKQVHLALQASLHMNIPLTQVLIIGLQYVISQVL